MRVGIFFRQFLISGGYVYSAGESTLLVENPAVRKSQGVVQPFGKFLGLKSQWDLLSHKISKRKVLREFVAAHSAIAF